MNIPTLHLNYAHRFTQQSDISGVTDASLAFDMRKSFERQGEESLVWKYEEGTTGEEELVETCMSVLLIRSWKMRKEGLINQDTLRVRLAQEDHGRNLSYGVYTY